MSFRARLVLAAAYLVAAVVLALEIPLALNIERRADSDFQAAVLGRAALLSSRISDEVAAAGDVGTATTPAGLTKTVESEATSSGERVVVTDRRGRVLADSTGAAEPGSRFATVERPEFGVALAEGRVDYRRRYSETAGAELLLVTVPVLDGGRVVGSVRLSASRESVVDRVHRSWLRLAAIGSQSSQAHSCSHGSSPEPFPGRSVGCATPPGSSAAAIWTRGRPPRARRSSSRLASRSTAWRTPSPRPCGRSATSWRTRPTSSARR